MVSGLKLLVTRLVLAVVRQVLSRPRLKQAARALLARVPGLHTRLHRIMFKTPAPPPVAASAAQLSARARLHYLRLPAPKAKARRFGRK